MERKKLGKKTRRFRPFEAGQGGHALEGLERIGELNEREAGSLNFDYIDLERIDPDETNPRQIQLDRKQPDRLDPDDPDYEARRAYVERIRELALNI
ncbi:MAG: hypothetical protein D6698_05800, partial [Gammaproteobacteria bacterium]